MSSSYVKSVNVGGNEFDLKDDAARAMISDEYDQAKSYASGKLCIYENKLYKCIAAATGKWDATKWQETSLSEVTNELNGKMPEYTPTTQISTTYGIALKYVKYGKTIMVYAVGTTTQELKIETGAGILLGTIPQGLRPKSILFYPINSLCYGSHQLTLSIESNGKISMITTGDTITIAKSKYFNGVFMYISEA